MLVSLTNFAKKDLFQKKVHFWIGVISIALGTAFTLVFLAVIGSMYRISEEKTNTLSENEIRVTPLYRVGFLNVTKTEQKKIDDAAVNTLKTLPGVTEVKRETIAQFPASLEVNIFNTSFETDSPIYGIEDKEFEEKAKVKDLSGPEPVLLSADLLNIYNVGIAQAISKPQLNEQFLVGLPFTLKLGYSSFFRDQASEKQQIKEAKVAGISEGLSIVGVTLPLSRVLDLNKSYVGDSFEPVYSRVTVVLKSGSDYTKIKEQIKSMGFDATSAEDQLAPVKSQLAFVSTLLLGIVCVVLIFIVLNLFFLFYSQLEAKHYMISLLRIFGAKRRDIFSLFLIQVTYIALLGLGLGLGLGIGSIWLSNTVLLAEFPFIKEIIGTPLTLEWKDPVLLAIVLYLIVLCAVFYPAWRATKLLPRDVLAST